MDPLVSEELGQEVVAPGASSRIGKATALEDLPPVFQPERDLDGLLRRRLEDPGVEPDVGVPGDDSVQGAQNLEPYHSVLLGEESGQESGGRLGRRETREAPGDVPTKLLGKRRVRQSLRQEREARRTVGDEGLPCHAPRGRRAEHRQERRQTVFRSQSPQGLRDEALDVDLGAVGELQQDGLRRGRWLAGDGEGQGPSGLGRAVLHQGVEGWLRLVGEPARGDEADRTRGPDERTRVTQRSAQHVGLRQCARAGPERRGPDLGARAREEAIGDGCEVRAARGLEELESTENDALRRVVQDESGDELCASFLGQEVEGRDHLAVVPAVQGREERLERPEIQLGQLPRCLDRPFPESLAKEIDVVGPELHRRRDPHHGQGGGRPSVDRVVAVDHQLAHDEDRRDRLSAPLTHDVDQGLDAGPKAVREGKEQELGRRAVKRRAQRSV